MWDNTHFRNIIGSHGTNPANHIQPLGRQAPDFSWHGNAWNNDIATQAINQMADSANNIVERELDKERSEMYQEAQNKQIMKKQDSLMDSQRDILNKVKDSTDFKSTVESVADMNSYQVFGDTARNVTNIMDQKARQAGFMNMKSMVKSIERGDPRALSWQRANPQLAEAFLQQLNINTERDRLYNEPLDAKNMDGLISMMVQRGVARTREEAMRKISENNVATRGFILKSQQGLKESNIGYYNDEIDPIRTENILLKKNSTPSINNTSSSYRNQIMQRINNEENTNNNLLPSLEDNTIEEDEYASLNRGDKDFLINQELNGEKKKFNEEINTYSKALTQNRDKILDNIKNDRLNELSDTQLLGIMKSTLDKEGFNKFKSKLDSVNKIGSMSDSEAIQAYDIEKENLLKEYSKEIKDVDEKQLDTIIGILDIQRANNAERLAKLDSSSSQDSKSSISSYKALSNSINSDLSKADPTQLRQHIERLSKDQLSQLKNSISNELDKYTGTDKGNILQRNFDLIDKVSNEINADISNKYDQNTIYNSKEFEPIKKRITEENDFPTGSEKALITMAALNKKYDLPLVTKKEKGRDIKEYLDIDNYKNLNTEMITELATKSKNFEQFVNYIGPKIPTGGTENSSIKIKGQNMYLNPDSFKRLFSAYMWCFVNNYTDRETKSFVENIENQLVQHYSKGNKLNGSISSKKEKGS